MRTFCVLVGLVLWGLVAGCEDQRTASPPPPPVVAITALGEGASQGELTVKIVSLRVGNQPTCSIAGTQEGRTPPSLAVVFELKNTSQTALLNYDSVWTQVGEGFWDQVGALSDGGRGEMADDVGNKYDQQWVIDETRRFQAICMSQQLYPGSSLIETLVFPVPVKAASYLKIKFPGGRISGSSAKFQDFLFTVPVSLIKN